MGFFRERAMPVEGNDPTDLYTVLSSFRSDKLRSMRPHTLHTVIYTNLISDAQRRLRNFGDDDIGLMKPFDISIVDPLVVDAGVGLGRMRLTHVFRQHRSPFAQSC